MKKSTGDSPILKKRIIDGFDVFIILVALVIIALNINSRVKPVGKNLNGISGWMAINRIEKKIKDIEGVQSAQLHIYGDSSAVVTVFPWAGNYSIYESEVLSQVYEIVSSETGIPEDKIIIYDGDNGEKINPNQKTKNIIKSTIKSIKKQIKKYF